MKTTLKIYSKTKPTFESTNCRNIQIGLSGFQIEYSVENNYEVI